MAMDNIDQDLLQAINIFYTDAIEFNPYHEQMIDEMFEYFRSNVSTYQNMSVDSIINHILTFYLSEHPDEYDMARTRLDELRIEHMEFTYLSNFANLVFNEEFEINEEIYQDNNENDDDDDNNNTNDTPESNAQDNDNIIADLEDYLSSNLRALNISSRISSNIIENLRRLRPIRTDPIMDFQFEDIRVTVKKHVLDNMNVVKYRDISDAMIVQMREHSPQYQSSNLNVDAHEKQCTVCQDDYQDDDDVRILPCGHIFHKDCIDTWLLNYNYKCPVCRKECGEYEAQT